MSVDPTRSVPDLLGDLVKDSSELVRREFALARAEVNEKIGQIAGAAGGIAIGGVLLLAALIILLQALVHWLVIMGLSPALAALIVAVAVGAGGALALSAGLRRLRAASLTPERTVNQLSKDAAVAREKVE
ncbi:phage holin family protein [Plastoroseomonas hellenica]|uniref:Phage holin family protein n=1 Tax=Plastoroseomonas hellenica TaxID=2687306 RepID=A0ABS5F0U8_9PROT|nr:phage holin family protein [Plastoroseomonas hellenica]MBR0644832.1 phage holin family protein [Plastoroseomonas hellenica]MBR0666113.1 phage holin family protein [Plastoroseomonas hellenica]